jgi:hypothetical protein
MLYYAAMAGRSSLLAAVIRHTRSAAAFSVVTGPGWHTPAQVTRSSPPHQEKHLPTSLGRSPTTLTDHCPRWTGHPCVIPHRLYRPAQHSGKSWIRVVEKITVFRSSAVSSAPRCHHPLRRKSSMVSPTTAQLPPPGSCRLPATDQPSLWAPQSLPQRCHHHRRFPRRVSFPRSMASPQPCAASELYSCGIQQRHRPTPAYNARYRPATCGNDHHGRRCPQFGTKRPGFNPATPRTMRHRWQD